MGEQYIILNLDTLKIATKWITPLKFNGYGDALIYAEQYIKNFKLIKL